MSAASKRYNGDKLPDNILKYIKGGSFGEILIFFLFFSHQKLISEGTNRDYMIKFIEDLHQTGKGGTMLGQAKQLLLDISKCWDRFEVIRTNQMVYMNKMIKCEEIIKLLQSNNTSAKQDYLTSPFHRTKIFHNSRKFQNFACNSTMISATHAIFVKSAMRKSSKQVRFIEERLRCQLLIISEFLCS